MSPKFRGNGNDYLDDEDAGMGRSPARRKKKVPEARSLGLSSQEANAIVAEVFPNQCRVILDSNQSSLLCSYRRAGVVSKVKAEGEIRERSPVAVGDRVLVKSTGSSTGVIEGVCVRRNCLSRPAPGRDGVKIHHVIAANVDFVLVVASVQEPEFSSGVVDRFLIAAEAEGIAPLLCITKLDLLGQGDSPAKGTPWSVYPQLGYGLFEVSPKEAVGLESLLKVIQDKTVVFCGHSGVGKTSLLRRLLGSDIGRVGQVNEQTGKGRHTTTGAVLLGGPGISKWIDTPGIRAFGLAKIAPHELSQNFPEFRNLACPQVGCLHVEELGCLAQSFTRYSAYRRILESILAGDY